MADSSDSLKAQKRKLASTKKRFKELLEQKKQNEKEDGDNSPRESATDVRPPDNILKSPDNILKPPDNAVKIENCHQENANREETHIPNYFSGALNTENLHNPATFFDSFIHSPPEITPEGNQYSYASNFVNSYFQQVPYGVDASPQHGAVAFEDPELQPNPKLEPNAQQPLNPQLPDPESQANPQLLPNSQLPPNLQLPPNPQLQPSPELQLHPQQTSQELQPNPELQPNIELHPNLEVQPNCLNQNQYEPDVVAVEDPELRLNDGIFHNVSASVEHSYNVPEFSQQHNVPNADNMVVVGNKQFSNDNTIELERRNRELTELLEQERVRTDQMYQMLQDFQLKYSQLEMTVNESRNGEEAAKLQEELQSHAKAVKLLVDEKAELEAELARNQSTLTQKVSECEELQNRLKTSRSRVADLERELNMLRGEKSKFDSAEKQHADALVQLQRQCQNLKYEKEELQQDLLESKEKLNTTLEVKSNLEEQVAQLQNQLSLANLKIQQISSGHCVQNDGIESLVNEKVALEKQIVELNEKIQATVKERDECGTQYQQYAQQLNMQIANLANKVEELANENETLKSGEESRIRHIGELERQLQNLQNEKVAFTHHRSNSEVRKELEGTKEVVEGLKLQINALNENYIKVLNEKEILGKDLEAAKDNIGYLETQVELLRGNQPNNVELLAAMESDKVAAARAIAQNNELKRQMEGMQEAFLKLNNDKMELTEKCNAEHKTNVDLLEKLQKTEIILQNLADAIEIKDKEMLHLRESFDEASKQILQQEQLEDRLRHYQAHDHSSHSLQNELQDAKQLIAQLTNELNTLKNNFSETIKKDNSHENDVEELKKNLQNLKIRNQQLENKVLELEGKAEHSCISDSTEADRIITRDNNNVELDKEAAMEHLERKFLKTMDDIANLTEEKQRLEHIIQQLQGETETIEEYVALYQHQRSVLKQKALEKEVQLKQLASDREQMKKNLEHLNALVKRLLLEKGGATKELLDHQESINRHSDNFCEEHSKLNSEINRITNQVVSDGETSGESATAEEIIALLTEIQTSNLVEPNDTFHNCPWCSGKLITV